MHFIILWLNSRHKAQINVYSFFFLEVGTSYCFLMVKHWNLNRVAWAINNNTTFLAQEPLKEKKKEKFSILKLVWYLKGQTNHNWVGTGLMWWLRKKSLRATAQNKMAPSSCWQKRQAWKWPGTIPPYFSHIMELAERLGNAHSGISYFKCCLEAPSEMTAAFSQPMVSTNCLLLSCFILGPFQVDPHPVVTVWTINSMTKCILLKILMIILLGFNSLLRAYAL